MKGYVIGQNSVKHHINMLGRAAVTIYNNSNRSIRKDTRDKSTERIATVRRYTNSAGSYSIGYPAL